MKEVHNFNAGPCVLPKEAVESTINAIRNFDNTGIGLMEISHRTPGWERLMAETRQLWRDLLNIPDNYEVLFLGGGASTQFFMVPGDQLAGCLWSAGIPSRCARLQHIRHHNG